MQARGWQYPSDSIFCAERSSTKVSYLCVVCRYRFNVFYFCVLSGHDDDPTCYPLDLRDSIREVCIWCKIAHFEVYKHPGKYPKEKRFVLWKAYIKLGRVVGVLLIPHQVMSDGGSILTAELNRMNLPDTF